MNDDADRLPPQSREAERSVLGSMLRDNDCIADVARRVRASDFYGDAHQKVFSAVLSLWDARKPVDAVTLADEMKRRGQIEDAGGYVLFAQLLDAAPAAANALHYADIVRAKSIQRGLIHSAAELLRDAQRPSGQIADLLRRAEQAIFALSELGAEGDAVPLRQALGEAADEAEAASVRQKEGQEIASGLSTGFHDLDSLLSGMQPEEVLVVGARPSVGKTALGGGIAAHVAARLHTPVFFVSLEQSRKALARRLWCADARVDSRKVRLGTPTTEEWSRLADSKKRIEAAMGDTLFIDDTGGQDVLRIAANARRLRRRAGVGLVVIDYLQLIEPSDPRQKRWEQVGAISRRLKALAKELGVPLLVLAQLNRESETRKDKRPILADLREGGQQEQDADVVMLLHRPEADKTYGGPHTPVEVIVAKNREGPTGTAKLFFHGPHVRFDNGDPAFD